MMYSTPNCFVIARNEAIFQRVIDFKKILRPLPRLLRSSQ